MAFRSINFTLGTGGIGTPIPGQDFISGMVLDAVSGSTPSGFVNGQAQEVFGTSQLPSLGILNDYSDETKASATVTLTLGATGDVCTTSFVEPGINGTTNIVVLSTYTVKSTDTTATILAASIANSINIGTSKYTATSATDVITIKARPGMGIAVNGLSGTPLTFTVVGTTTAVVTQFTGGVASKQAVWYYQISEFFRLQPSGILWVGFFDLTTITDYSVINTMQIQAGGAIRQISVNPKTGITGSGIEAVCGLIQAQATILFNNYTPLSVVYAPNLLGVTNLATLPNLRTYTDNYVSVCIAQDGGNLGAWLSFTTGASVPAIGACLGTIALAKVENDIAWVGAFNVSNGAEDEVIAFSTDAILYNNVQTNLLGQLDTYGYIFLMPKAPISGSYWNDSHCAITITSDYAYIERNRVIGKAQRIIYTSFVPLENSDLVLNANGTLATSTINIFKDALAPSMKQMVANGEISAYACLIDPTQNVESTSTIAVTVQIVGVGIARNINVLLGYVLSL